MTFIRYVNRGSPLQGRIHDLIEGGRCPNSDVLGGDAPNLRSPPHTKGAKSASLDTALVPYVLHVLSAYLVPILNT